MSEPPSAALRAYNQLEARVHSLECLRFQVAAEHSDLIGLRAQIDEFRVLTSGLQERIVFLERDVAQLDTRLAEVRASVVATIQGVGQVLVTLLQCVGHRAD